VYPKNAWYVACTPDEIKDKPLGRQICGEKIAFFRGKENKVSAVLDFCPHRGAPLSIGYVEDGNLVCGYHGLAMGENGVPSSMPGQRVKGFPCNKVFAVEERHGFIWVWPGNTEKANRDLIPQLEWANSPDWAYGGGLYHIKCDYRLMVDNLMDLTHETYVHSSSIGQKEIDEAPVDTKIVDGEVLTTRFMDNIKAPPFWAAALEMNGLPADADVDRWQICRFSPPSNIMIDVGVALAGKGGINAKPEDKAGSVVVDFITPETETSIWYFWGMARQFKVNDQELTDKIREGQGAIFSEDLEVLELQQENLLRFPENKLLKLNIDGGGIQARRIIERMLKKETV